MKTHLTLMALISVMVLACDDDAPGEYDGMYVRTLHTTYDTCDGTTYTEEEIVDPYFRLHHENFFGTPIIAWYDCEGPESGTCDDSIQLFGSFVEIDGVWQQYMSSSSFSSPDICHLNLTRGILEPTEEGIAWTVTQKMGSVTVASEDECEPELADQYEEDLTCFNKEYYKAQLLE